MKGVASMDYSVCFSPTMQDKKQDGVAGRAVDYRWVVVWVVVVVVVVTKPVVYPTSSLITQH